MRHSQTAHYRMGLQWIRRRPRSSCCCRGVRRGLGKGEGEGEGKGEVEGEVWVTWAWAWALTSGCRAVDAVSGDATCSGERAEVGLSAQGDAAVGSKRGVVVGGVGGCVVEVERDGGGSGVGGGGGGAVAIGDGGGLVERA